MLDIRYIEKNRNQVVEKLLSRGELNVEQLVTELVSDNEERRRLQLITDKLLASLKKKTDEVASFLKKGDKKGAEACKQVIKTLKLESKTLLQTLKELENQVQNQLLALPNLPHTTVPEGKTYAQNSIVATWPKHKDLLHTPKPHWELLARYNLASFEQGNKITGAGFPVYHGKGARLQRGLINFFLDQAIAHGYQEIQVPLLVNKKSALGTGQLPDKENIMYTLQGENRYLIPTAEVPVTNVYRDTILQEKDLPIKHVAYTPCFRQEAGSWGRHVRGLNRLHQFDKVEIVQIQMPENAALALEEMRKYVTGLLEKLGLPYRVLKLCTGELGFTAALTYDVEVWSSGQKQWLEVSSISLFETFQARRMQLRYKQGHEKHFCHTLNASALALPRVMAALLENFQTPTSIDLPQILHPYVGFQQIKKLDF